jgi:hypothetical protein
MRRPPVRSVKFPFACIAVAVALAACAPQVRVAPAQMLPLSSPAPEVLVAADVPIRLSTGYTRTVPGGSRWRAAGTLPQGVVYRPVDTVFAIEGRQVHEAYLVLQGGAIQGFYLPAESRYSALQQPVTLPIPTGVRR